MQTDCDVRENIFLYIYVFLSYQQRQRILNRPWKEKFDLFIFTPFPLTINDFCFQTHVRFFFLWFFFTWAVNKKSCTQRTDQIRTLIWYRFKINVVPKHQLVWICPPPQIFGDAAASLKISLSIIFLYCWIQTKVRALDFDNKFEMSFFYSFCFWFQ